MSTLHDIYDPPPAPIAFAPPRPDPIAWSSGDLVGLALMIAPFLLAAGWAATVERSLGVWVVLGGAFVVMESWLSALTFLQRHPAERSIGRWKVYLAALLPWVLGLGLAAALLSGLFLVSDWAG